MTSWKRVSLSTILQPRKTKDIPAKFPDLPYIGMEHVARDLGTIDLLGRSAEYRSSAPKVFKGDVLYGRLRPYLNKVVIAPGEAFASGEFIVLPANDAITNKFLQYRLLSQDFVEFAGTLDTGDRPRVSWEQISKFEIDLPTLPEQQKIVEILEDHLSRLDAALADVKLAKLKAAQFRRSLLQAAFTGNLTGNRTGLKTEWQNKTLGELVSIKTGKIDANQAVENGKYPFFTCAREISRIDDAPYEGKVVLVAGNGDLNVKYYEGKFNAYQRTYFLTSLDESNALPKYIYFFMEHYLQILRTQSIGTTVKYIKMENLSDANIPFPTIVEQHKIVELLEDHLSCLDASVAIADAMEKQSASLRRSLLQAAFTGKLTKEVASV